MVLTDLAARFDELPSGSWPRPPADAMVLPLRGETGAPPLGVSVLFHQAARTRTELIASELLVPVLEISGLSRFTIVHR